METVTSDLAHVSGETGSEGNSSLLQMENGKPTEHIKFGSHGTDEPVKKEVKNLPQNNFLKDAVDEWPSPKQIHSFYIVKYRLYDDPKLKVKLDQADKELQKLNQARVQITEKLKSKRADRAEVIAHLRSVSVETRQFRMIMDEKRKEMEPLQQALGKLRNSNMGSREKGFICSSEAELNDFIKSLQYRIQHESIPLTEEKQILREIKQLEGTRDKVIANAAMRAKIQDSLGEKEAIQDQVKLIGVDLDGVRKEQQVVKAKLKQLDDEKEAIEKVINSLQEELTAVIQKRDKAFERIQELRKQRDEGNASFYQNRSLLIKARELAAKKDVETLKEISDTEVDNFISMWSSNKTFKDDYESRILTSLDIRQLSRDGRIRNPDEKPLVLQEPPTTSEPKIVAKPNLKQPKDDSITSTIPKVQKEKPTKQQKEANNKVAGAASAVENSDLQDRDGISGLEKVEKDPPPKRNEADELKLKELKREEEMAKAKLALERKKKLAEKVAAKAAIKAQKEAEKKLKDREKKAKKKAAASVSVVPEEPTEEAAEVTEPENAEEIVEPAVVPSKTKERMENTARYNNRSRAKGLPKKIIPKRKKSSNYWVWAVPAALLVLILSLVIGYYYLYLL